MNDHLRYELIKMYTHSCRAQITTEIYSVSFMKNHTKTNYLMKIFEKRINFDKK